MTPEQVLSLPPRVLTQAQREFYFSDGYLLLRSHLEHDFRQDPGFAALVSWCHSTYDQDACFGTFLHCLVD